MVHYLIIGALLLAVVACQRNQEVHIPDNRWPPFDSAAATALQPESLRGLEGVYRITEGTDLFGGQLAARLSSRFLNGDTVYQLSFFCEKNGAVIICQGKQLRGSVILKGYFLNLEGNEAGTVRFTLRPDQGADALLGGNGDSSGKLVITGLYGEEDKEPNQPLNLNWERPLYKEKPLEIIAHRGGGRTNDYLPASENSVELIRMAESLGATGVEIDVQCSKDGIPFLYHDAKINDRLTQKSGIRGPLQDYTAAELKDLRLKKGEQLPTLEQALEVILQETKLRYVWLDAKEKEGLDRIRTLQEKYIRAAESRGRKLEITIGIHDEKVWEAFRKLPGYQQIPSVCELEPDQAAAVNARIWAPIWTKGLQEEDVSKMHGQGRRVFVWTVDLEDKMEEFMKEGGYDGVVSNYAGQVAYYHYTRK